MAGAELLARPFVRREGEQRHLGVEGGQRRGEAALAVPVRRHARVALRARELRAAQAPAVDGGGEPDGACL